MGISKLGVGSSKAKQADPIQRGSKIKCEREEDGVGGIAREPPEVKG
jgi:hypothetical protein